TVATRCASRSAASQRNSKRNKEQQLLQQQVTTLSGKLELGDENKVETLIEDEAQSKEAGQSQQLEENIQEEQDEEEEDPDIGVESFVSGDISRPCPESEAVQLALGYFDWLAEDWSGATGCTKPKHSRRYAYEIYSTFLHEESPLSLLASNSDADASRQQLHDEAVHPLERLFGIGASTGADPASTVRQGAAADKPRPGADAPTLARLATGALADLQQKRRDGFLSDLLPALPGGSTPEQRRLFAARCRPGLLARLRMLRQSESAPAAAEASCLATLLVRASIRNWPSRWRRESRRSQKRRQAEVSAKPDGPGGGLGSLGFVGIWSGARRATARWGARFGACALTKAQVCAACDQVLCGAAPQGLQCTADCEQVVHRSCAQQPQLGACTKRAAARAKDASIGSVKASKSFGGSSNRRRLRHQRHPSSQASTPPAMPRQRFAGGRIDEVEDWMLSGRQVQRNIPDCADDLPILKLTSSRSDQALFLSHAIIALQQPHQLSQTSRSISSSHLGTPATAEAAAAAATRGGGFNKRASIGRSQSVKTPGSPRVPEFQPDKKPAKVGDGGAEPVRGWEQQPRPPDFDRYKDYQLALHELVFACASHLRALTVLQLLFVQRWPRSCLPMLRQLGLHFVPECVSLYRSLLAS
uniref:Phorbol-ester/DAG-type domain-containing protein n=1 Tax=Macrostomum lignano TaxID=282301 RepID=A0A1I8FFV1_9PLAT